MAKPKLDAAIAIFQELGWDQATPEQVFELPLGTPEQQKIARAGLAKGPWEKWDYDGEGNYGPRWLGSEPVDKLMLGAFAVRLGVPAARVLDVIPQGWHARNAGWNGVLVGRLLAEHGEAVVQRAMNNRSSLWLAEAIVVALATHTQIEVSANADYLEEWTRLANQAFGLRQEWYGNYGQSLDMETVQASFERHLRAATQLGGPLYQGLFGVVQRAVELGWIEATQWREPVLFAMDRAVRPSDRDLWARVLTDVLGADEQWLVAHSSVVLSAMSSGQEKLVARFAPVLVHSGIEDVLVQTLLIGLNVKSAKGKLGVIEQALAAPAPCPENALMLAESVATLTSHKNAKLAKAAGRLLEQWRVPVVEESGRGQEPGPVRGLWRPTPPVAAVPRLELGPVTAENLSDTLGRIVALKSSEVSLDTERFLALWVALRAVDPEGAAIVTRKMPSGPAQVLGVVDYVRRYPEGTDFIRDHFHQRPLLYARDYAVVKWLDAGLVVVLSTPSFVDWRLDPADLVARLAVFEEAGRPVLEPDLQLALTRLDLGLLSEELRAELGASTVPIVLLDGTVVTTDEGKPLTVGEVFGQWCDEPLAFPGFDAQHPGFMLADFEPVEALRFLPDRQCRYNGGIPVYPVWADQVPGLVGSGPATLRWEPNGPCMSAYVLNTVGTDSPARLEDAIVAFENGVLRPGVAQARFLVESGKVQSLAARARDWAELAEAGLLSVVWFLADEVVGLSAAAGRLWPGTDALIELLAGYVGEVRAAIDAGVAEESVFDLPGVRAVAAKAGSSRAVKVAKALVEQLPEVSGSEMARPDTRMDDEEFMGVWPEYPDPEPVPDGAVVEPVGDCSDQKYQVVLPDGSRFELRTRWYYIFDRYDLMRLEVKGKDPNVGYSCEKGELVVWGDRYKERSEDDRVMSQSLVEAYLLRLWLDPDSFPHRFGPDSALEGLGPSRVRAALPRMWDFPGFDPYKVVRRVAASPGALPVLYPVLVDAVARAARMPGKPPAWVARLLGVVVHFAPVLRAAGERGRIPTKEAKWPGLADLAEHSPSPAVRRKAADLLDQLGLR